MRQLPLSVRLRDRASFESFLAGPNSTALQQIRSLAEHPRPGLVWLYGPEGSGKTHLLQSLCAQAGSEAVYLPLSQLESYGASAISDWQGGRWLCLDDVAWAAGRSEWERALFAVYRDCEERGACLLMAAREPPSQVGFALQDLASRCAADTGLPCRLLMRNSRSQRSGSVPSCAASSFLRRRRTTCSGGCRATWRACLHCWMNWTRPRWPRSAASPFRSYATSLLGARVGKRARASRARDRRRHSSNGSNGSRPGRGIRGCAYYRCSGRGRGAHRCARSADSGAG